MSRVYLLVLALVVAATLVGLAIAEQSGYVLIAYKSFRYESSLWTFLALLALVWLLYLALRLVLRLVGVSGRVVNPWSRFNRARRAEMAEEHGQRDLAEGHWAQALRHLRRAAELGERSLSSFLGAARAANELGRFDECDELLDRALERQPGAALAVGLTRAQLLINRGAFEPARAVLVQLHEEHPRHPTVLRLLQQLYVSLQDWRPLLALLPELRKERVLANAQLSDLERRAWIAALEAAGEQGLGQGETALQPLTQSWQGLPANLRAQPPLLAAYAQQLLRLGAPEEAEKVLRQALKEGYDERLMLLYGQARGSDPARQLQSAEAWLKKYPDDPSLLLSLGRLCLADKLWGKAREYLEASLGRRRSPEACAELARLLAQLGETERSNKLFQEGLGLLGAPVSGVALVPVRA
ncbi:heme biosynthesis HemY N-terminal domain-containing protein [Pseudomonas citronellolis]|uniref:heme biosynthesis HemY N-terminal domain-containing protein n=1 Tax=Pseudomonas citronellolis TaxID=53408 RepID=UPI0023E41BC7|nr:heme biosynthesis HemY N-terminal domain-containing protein [Pseudomonas citronellolis]MDF3936856.1 heme biosynthesis HemY N-terminal domain-containing protein [Pseudomonas citronellolis]